MSNFRARLRLYLVLVVAMLMGTSSGQDEVVDATQQDLAILEENTLGDRCVAHELNVPGQVFHLSGSEFHLSGSVGGMVLGEISYTDPQGSQAPVIFEALAVGDVLSETGFAAAGGPLFQEIVRDTMIVVADDFAGGLFKLPQALFSLSDSPSGLVELSQLVDNAEISHGAMVMHQLNALISATGGFTLQNGTSSSSDESYWHWVQDSSGRALIVAALDLSAPPSGNADGFISAQEVFDSLEKSLDDLRQFLTTELGLQLPALVVNMSWVFLPCKTVEAFVNNKDSFEDFGDYLEGIGISPNTSLESLFKVIWEVDNQALTNLLTGEVPAEWMLGFIDQGGRLAFVAAAGNFGLLTYQLLPAGWSQVVGTGVVPEPVQPRVGYSNPADVMVAGEWFALQPIDGTGVLGALTELSYAGTSFAAPLTSLYVVSDLALATPVCTSGYNQVSELVTVQASVFSTPLSPPLMSAIANCLP